MEHIAKVMSGDFSERDMLLAKAEYCRYHARAVRGDPDFPDGQNLANELDDDADRLEAEAATH